MDMLSYLLGKHKGGGDASDYVKTTITSGTAAKPGWINSIKKLYSPLTPVGNSLSYAFANYDFDVPTPEITDTSNITNMRYMYYNCSNPNVENIENFNIANCSEFNAMLQNAKGLTKIDLSNWDKGNSNYDFYIENMFAADSTLSIQEYTLTEIIMPHAVLNQKLWISGTFSYNKKLKKIDMSNIITTGNNYIVMGSTFAGCIALEELDISGLDFTKVQPKTHSFDGVPTNCLIYVKDQQAVDWFTTNFPDMTNVQIKGA